MSSHGRSDRPAAPRRGGARTALLDAAVDVIRRKGFAATTVDDLCAAAGVSKGAFFHHFDSKEALAVAAADHWSATTSAMFAAADFHRRHDPAERTLAYLDLRKELLDGPIAEYTCLVGTLAQETFDSSPAIRDAAWDSIRGHAATLEPDLVAALTAAGFDGDPAVEARRLALYMQAVIQGAFVVSKAADDPAIARDNLDQLRRDVAARLRRVA